MNGNNGYKPPSSMNLIFAFIDGLLILSGVLLGGMLRFGGGERMIYNADYLVWKIMLIVLVMQTVMYYFDLYEFRSFRGRMRMGILMLETMGVSSVILAVIYFFVPFLAIGRGFFTISLFMIFLMNFTWRLVYPWIVNKSIFKEKILIIGTGDLAQKIQKEILQNGQETFEIVGFIGERSESVGKNSVPDDYRELRPDLFNLPRRSG
jgi:FlaA1/EpsC-like NDP-sugar epimerase